MKFLLLLILSAFTLSAFCQERTVSGVVADKSTQERIAKVSVTNTRNGKVIYNNLKAEFTITARPGDVLVFNRQGYFSDTLKVPVSTDMAVYLKPKAIMLKQVTIKDSLLSPTQRLAKAKEENSKAYGSLANHDLLSVGPGVGAGISIDAIWNMLSRSGRNATHLRKLIDQDYRQDVIDYRFNKPFVAQITGLTEPNLTQFMQRFRPSYYMVTVASDYEFIKYIKGNLMRYQRNPHGVQVQPLPQITTASK
ncbi:hypothetical protein GCM10027037_27680 [Mucilaginibacter koreensis]